MFPEFELVLCGLLDRGKQMFEDGWRGYPRGQCCSSHPLKGLLRDCFPFVDKTIHVQRGSITHSVTELVEKRTEIKFGSVCLHPNVLSSYVLDTAS